MAVENHPPHSALLFPDTEHDVPKDGATPKCHICRLLVHEACKRHVSGVLDRNEVHKFEFVLKVGEMTERNDISNHADCAMFLPEGTMSISKLRRGYHEHYSFVWLRVHGNIEAQMELQTFLRLTTTEMQTKITNLKKEFLQTHENEEESQEESQAVVKKRKVSKPSES